MFSPAMCPSLLPYIFGIGLAVRVEQRFRRSGPFFLPSSRGSAEQRSCTASPVPCRKHPAAGARLSSDCHRTLWLAYLGARCVFRRLCQVADYLPSSSAAFGAFSPMSMLGT